MNEVSDILDKSNPLTMMSLQPETVFIGKEFYRVAIYLNSAFVSYTISMTKIDTYNTITS